MRPNAVTFVSILIVVSGVLLILTGFGGFSEESLIMLDNQFNSNEQINLGLDWIVIAAGMGYLIMTCGLLEGNKRVWYITIVIVIIGIVVSMAHISWNPDADFLVFPNDMSLVGEPIIVSMVSIAISALVLYYLYRPQVKSFFGLTLEEQVTDEEI